MGDLVSIVLPVYNGEKYLRESIDSVISQTYQNWELLIVDDCSSDRTREISEEYCHRDLRIKYFHNEHNLRLPRNLNKGFSLTKGQFLTWTSDDNRYRPDAIEKMHSALVEKKADFVFASCRVIDGEGKEIEYMMVGQNSPQQLIGHNVVGACFMYTRRAYERTGEYDPELTLVEDYDYWQRLYTNFGAVVIDEILYEYRWRDGALTSTMKKEQFNCALEEMLLKNRKLFGTVDYTSNYYFYSALYKCRKGCINKFNPYTLQYYFYDCLYIVGVRFPNKIKKMWKKATSK